MSLAETVRRSLAHRVMLKRKTGHSEDGWAQPTYADPVEVPARVENRSQLIRKSSGQQAISSTQIVFAGDTQASLEDALAVMKPSGEYGDYELIEAVDEDVALDGTVVARIAFLER